MRGLFVSFEYAPSHYGLISYSRHCVGADSRAALVAAPARRYCDPHQRQPGAGGCRRDGFQRTSPSPICARRTSSSSRTANRRPSPTSPSSTPRKAWSAPLRRNPPAACKGVNPPPPPPPIATRPKQVRRTVALVVDDLGLSFESIARVRQSLKRYVDQRDAARRRGRRHPHRRRHGLLQQFTSDKRMLYAAIDHVKYNSFGRVGISSIEPLQGVDPQNPHRHRQRR